MLSLLLISLQLDAGLPVKPAPSATEKRLLHDAVKTTVYFDHLQAFKQQCPQAAELLIIPEQERLEQALTTQLHFNKTQWDSFISHDNELKQFAGTVLPANNIDCNNTDYYQNLADDYELAVFSVEIATPLSHAPQSDADKALQQKQQKAEELHELFDKSTTIVVATIVPAKVLNEMDRANYLHPDYAGDYIYMVEQGWKKYTKHYIGMATYIDDAARAKTADKWLLFFDLKGSLTESIPYQDIKHRLKDFNQPDWSFDPSGNLERKH